MHHSPSSRRLPVSLPLVALCVAALFGCSSSGGIEPDDGGDVGSGGLTGAGGTAGAAGAKGSGGVTGSGGMAGAKGSGGAAGSGSGGTAGAKGSGGSGSGGSGSGGSGSGGKGSGGSGSGGSGSGGVAGSGGGSRGLTPKAMVKEMALGWNLGNTFDAVPNETSWGNPATTQAMILAVKNAGFKTMRIPVTWRDHMGAAPSYTVDAAWMDKVDQVAKWVLDAGMYAIVNVHHDGGGDGWVTLSYASQTAVTAKLTALWTQIANRFNKYNDYLVFETLNEPQGPVNTWTGGNAEQQTVLNAYHLAAVNAIRGTGGTNAQRLIMVPPHGASPYQAGCKALVIPNNDARVIISIHTYYPTGFSLNANPNTWGSTAADYTAMAASLNDIQSWFPNRAVVIGEWGAIASNQLASREKHAKAYTQDATRRGFCPIVWDNGAADFGLLNRKVSPPTWTYPTIVNNLVAGATAGWGGAGDATM